MLSLNPGSIPNVINVAMRQQKGVDVVALTLEPVGRVLGRVHKDAGVWEVVAVCFEQTACEDVYL